MTDPTPPPEEDAIPDPWEPVDDLESEDFVPAPAVVEEVVPDPFAPLGDEADDELPLAPVGVEELDDPWTDGAIEEPEGLVPAPPMPQWPEPPPEAVLLDETPRGSVTPLPWRTSAEMRTPAASRLLCEADARIARSRLRVASWEWFEGGDAHVAFRLADDGEDIIVRVIQAETPVFEAALRVAGQELRAELELVTDREGRGLILGRDLLVGRFVIDPARQDWEL